MSALVPIIAAAAFLAPLYLWFWVRALANLAATLVRGH